MNIESIITKVITAGHSSDYKAVNDIFIAKSTHFIGELKIVSEVEYTYNTIADMSLYDILNGVIITDQFNLRSVNHHNDSIVITLESINRMDSKVKLIMIQITQVEERPEL